MNPKQYKYIELICELPQSVNNDAARNKLMKKLLELDYAKAAEIWEYILISNENLLKDPATAIKYGDDIFALFEAKSGAKAYKTMTDIPAVCKVMCFYSPKIGVESGKTFNYLIDLLIAGKLKDGEEMLKNLCRNEAIGDDYGKVMKKLVERIFVELMKKSATKRVEMPKKLALLLKTYISKIKTDERAMLEQRIKELL